MDNSLKGLILAAGTIITCVVISLGFFISREAKDTASNGANQIHKLNAEFAESDKTIYDGTRVSGSEVINVIKKFSNEKVGVLVKTNKESNYYGYKFDTKTGNIYEKSSLVYNGSIGEDAGNYINPYENYSGTVIRDSNGTITGIVFEQN